MSQTNPTLTETTIYAGEFILHGDMSRSFRATFPDSKAKPENINSKASKFHALVTVQTRLAELQEISKEQSEEEFSLSTSKIKKMLSEAAESGLQTKIDAQGNTIPINIPGAVSALSEINKMDGNHAAVKNEVKINGATLAEDLTDDELANIAAGRGPRADQEA